MIITAGVNLLMQTAGQGYRKIARLLIALRANMELLDVWYRTPLMHDARYGHTGIFQALLEAPRIEKDAQDIDGYTALMLAASEGHADTVKALLDKGADASTRGTEGETALSLAGDYPAVLDLLKSISTPPDV